jgi:two-component system, chemotaxis family, chemotaxis protein CheY
MTLDIIEHETPAALIGLIDRINANPHESWGCAVIRRDYLRSMTNEAFALSIKSVMQGAGEPHVFFAENKSIYIAWCGKQKSVYLNLRSFISTALMMPGLTVDPAVMVAYLDPRANAEQIREFAKVEKATRADEVDEELLANFKDEVDENENLAPDSISSTLTASREQIDLYREAQAQKPYRKQLQLLVVEDQVFSQKLLCEILRSVRVRNNNESPVIDATTGIHEAWKTFLKKAPDIVFIDLNLSDGSGHTLARAIKEVDAAARIVIVTANNYEEEIGVARQNNVDNFIGKPYNKKQILDCVDSYIGTLKKPGEQTHGKSRRL